MNVRSDFPFFQQPFIYLDSASTSQKPKVVIDKITEFYEKNNANVHRGMYKVADTATTLYENARKTIAKFLNSSTEEIVFTRSITEAINLVAFSWGLSNIKKGDTILLTELEHHSNIVPWQILAKRVGAKLAFVPITKSGELDRAAFSSLIKQKPKLFSVTHISNVLGTVNPIKELVKEAHACDVKVFVDAAQSVPRMPVDVKDLDCDFLAFTGHKTYGPMGSGALFAKKEILSSMGPAFGGGSMVKKVCEQESTWADSPNRFEAGTPNVAGMVALASAIDYINKIGIDKIQAHEDELTKYARGLLKKDPAISLYGPENSLGVISFNLGDMHGHDVSAVLDEENICVRSGHHCAMILMEKLGVASTVRVSFGPYNTKEDVDKLMAALQKAKEVFKL